MHRSSNRRLLLAGFLLVVIGVVALPIFNMAQFALMPLNSGAKETAIIEVNRGQSPADVSKLLANQNIIEDAKKFQQLGRLTRQWKKMKAGEYQVSPAMSPLEILSIITSGVSLAHPITVREGENIYEIAEDLENKKLTRKEKFLDLCRSTQFMNSQGFKAPYPPSLEGYLFPDTYFFNRTMSAEDMLRQMTKRFFSVWNGELEAQAERLNLSRHQVVTLASIIEKETGAPEERPLISAVFHNRLKKRMRLQSDPTTIYGIWTRYDGNIHREDLLSRTPYNTYAIPALPVGPIGNPGKEAILAALNPATADYLYFVSHNDGTHQFSRSLEEHNSAVRKFQMDRKARQGKSWRDLSRRRTGEAAQP